MEFPDVIAKDLEEATARFSEPLTQDQFDTECVKIQEAIGNISFEARDWVDAWGITREDITLALDLADTAVDTIADKQEQLKDTVRRLCQVGTTVDSLMLSWRTQIWNARIACNIFPKAPEPIYVEALEA
jgi:hypothetical protein